MKNTFVLLVTILLFVGISHMVQGQYCPKYYKTGYIVTLENDTLRGKVRVGSKKLKLARRNHKKVLKFRTEDFKAFRHGRHSYENIKGDIYRVLVDGAVRFYIQDYTFFNGLSSGQNNYYCVKRPNEEKVTVLYVKRQGVNHVYLETGNVWTDIVADIFVMAASNIAEDLHATGQVSINDLKKTAAEYFEDCPPLVKRIEASKYNSPNTIHKLVERYNFYKVNNPAGDN